MDIFINGTKIAYQPSFPLNWGDLIKDLQENRIQQNHGIVKIILDEDEPLTLTAGTIQRAVPQNISRVKIFTRDKFSISKEGFINALALIDSIRCEIPVIANLYREGQTKRASGIIKKVLETVTPMMDFVNSVGINFSLNFEKIFLEQGITLRQGIGDFLRSLADLGRLKGERGNNEIADFLENRFAEEISTFNKIIKELLREISKITDT